LVQLVQVYEAERHAIDTTGLTGLDSRDAPKHLLHSDLALTDPAACDITASYD
jgi:hypothetical protein